MLAVLLAAAFVRTAGAAPAEATKLVPPRDGASYFGFTFRLFDSSDPIWGDTRSFDERIRDSIENELAGKTPTFLSVWAAWQRPDLPKRPLVPFSEILPDIQKVSGVVGESGIVYLDWNITPSAPGNDGITTRNIEAGELDRYIRHYALAIKEYGRPLLIRLLNGEYNGSWWWGVSPLANHSLSTKDFVAAWRRVVDIFRAVGVGNVSWAWVVNAYPEGFGQEGIDKNIAAYYPGDDYVDWVGADFYDVGPPSWLDGPYAFATAHDKPFFVGEFGIRHEWSSLTTAQQRAWLDASFDYFESHPAIKAISYFNYCNRAGSTRYVWDPSRSVYTDDGRVNYVPDFNDHDHRLLAGGPEMQALFSRRIDSPRYLTTVVTTTVQTQPLVATAALLPMQRVGQIATIRWRGNLAADSFDVQLRRRQGIWRETVTLGTATSRRLRGSRGERVSIRVRAHDVQGTPGPWSAPRTLRFR
jgi:hypothetical protein